MIFRDDRYFATHSRRVAWRLVLIFTVSAAVCAAVLVGFTGRADANHTGNPVVSTNTYCGHDTKATSWSVNGAISTRIVHAYSVTYGTHVHVYRLQRAEYGGWWSGTKWVTYDTKSRTC